MRNILKSCLSFFSQHVNTYKLLNYRSSCSALYTTEMLPQSERDVSLCHLNIMWSFFHTDEALQDPCFINWGYKFFLERPRSENRWSLCPVCIFAHVLLVRVWVRLSGSIQQSKDILRYIRLTGDLNCRLWLQPLYNPEFDE